MSNLQTRRAPVRKADNFMAVLLGASRVEFYPAPVAPETPEQLLTGRSFASKPISKRAKVLDDAEVRHLFGWIEANSRCPEADTLKFALSFFAGLRVGEIQQLTLADVTGPTGHLLPQIRIPASNTKTRQERLVPMHPAVRTAFEAFRSSFPESQHVAISRRYIRYKRQSVTALTNQFHRIYIQAGFVGCSSHSGRRTFITNMARRAHEVGASLRDVQLLAGHARLDTTEAYIEPTGRLGDIVNLLATP